MNQIDLKEFLDTKVELYNTTHFIQSDPIQIPHQLRDLGAGKEDIEIISFLVAWLGCVGFCRFAWYRGSLGFRWVPVIPLCR